MVPCRLGQFKSCIMCIDQNSNSKLKGGVTQMSMDDYKIERDKQHYHMTNLIETLSTGKLRNIYTDYSLDKQARDKLMFQVRDQVIEKVSLMLRNKRNQ